jgi:hypothetical protein
LPLHHAKVLSRRRWRKNRPGAVETEMLQELSRNPGTGDAAAGYAILTEKRHS